MPCCLRLLAIKVAPSTSLMLFLLVTKRLSAAEITHLCRGRERVSGPRDERPAWRRSRKDVDVQRPLDQPQRCDSRDTRRSGPEDGPRIEPGTACQIGQRQKDRHYRQLPRLDTKI